MTAACKLGFAAHTDVFDFGVGAGGDAVWVTASTVAFDAFVALLFELVVDAVSLQLEARQGIPVDTWVEGATPAWAAYHAATGLVSIAVAFMAYTVWTP